MIPKIEKIELAIMNHHDFNFRQNLIVFRVMGGFSLVVNHECDCLIMSKAGYLTEIEIKRSYADFLNEFKKDHKHNDSKIAHFYFMVHESFYEKVLAYLIDHKLVPSGIYVYDDNCKIAIGNTSFEIRDKIGNANDIYLYYLGSGARKLFIEEQYQLARLGAMRYKTMTEKLLKQ